jgi:Zn-dependent protease
MQLSLLVFNLLSPAYPLDGGRILVDLLSLRGLALESAARVAAFLSFLTGLGICVYALAAGAFLTLPVGIWVLVQAWELVQKVRRGEAHTHPMFLHYGAQGALPQQQQPGQVV